MSKKPADPKCPDCKGEGFSLNPLSAQWNICGNCWLALLARVAALEKTVNHLCPDKSSDV